MSQTVCLTSLLYNPPPPRPLPFFFLFIVLSNQYIISLLVGLKILSFKKRVFKYSFAHNIVFNRPSNNYSSNQGNRIISLNKQGPHNHGSLAKKQSHLKFKMTQSFFHSFYQQKWLPYQIVVGKS